MTLQEMATASKDKLTALSATLNTLAAIVALAGIPLFGFFATNMLSRMSSIEAQTRTTQQHVETLIEHRIAFLEAEVSEIRAELRERTANRFTSQHGQEMDARMRRDMDRMEAEIGRLRNIVEGSR